MNSSNPRATPNSCCGGDTSSPASAVTTDVRDTVREGYARIARGTTEQAGSTASACGAGGCCGPATFTPGDLAKVIGYSEAELSAVPDQANLGLSCGNPIVLASLNPGEVVLDLGSGAGFDCFIAGSKVGPSGRVIGVDMTADMLIRARANIAGYAAQTGLDNVEFRLGEIESLPVADSSVDVVISNCVLNLSPDKPRVWREIARVLRPGGRVAVSDLVLLRPLPAEVRSNVEALIGCVAGAVLAPLIENMAYKAGLTDVRAQRKGEYIDALTDWKDPLYASIIAALGPGERIGDYITSADITARKP